MSITITPSLSNNTQDKIPYVIIIILDVIRRYHGSVKIHVYCYDFFKKKISYF